MQNEQPDVRIEAPIVKLDLTFGDGFRFGCGFMSAIVVFWIVLLVLSTLMTGLAVLIAPNMSNVLSNLFIVR